MSTPLWQPNTSQIQQSQLYQFMQFINQQFDQHFVDYKELHQWSIQYTAEFWQSIWKWCKIISHTEASQIYVAGKHMLDSKWFVGAKLNFAENCLNQDNTQIAIIEVNENNQTRTITHQELRQSVQKTAAYLRQLGVTSNDCVAACLSNKASAIIAMLATTSIGACFTSCAPEFGVESILDRLIQVKPKVLFATLTHRYHGKWYHHSNKIQQIQDTLKLAKVIIDSPNLNNPSIKNAINMDQIPDTNQPLTFQPTNFEHPLTILFSSGTTGKPKCIVHSSGGTLIQHKKEHQLHCDIQPGDRVFFYTTTGWMMWNWLVSALASGATIICYDGSPTYPKADRLLDLVDQFNITHFGLGAKLIETMQLQQCQPNQYYRLDTLKTIMTTGSPLLPQSFDYIYTKVKNNICLSSISGGTDIISCFALGNPTLPVYRGQIQCRGLGMDVNVLNEHGQAVINEKGELVCQTPFPSMPIGFLNDKNQEQYRAAYFQRFDNTWLQSDYAMLTTEGGLIIFGRSDSTLNPGGVRIGTSEIYRALSHINGIGDAIAVGIQTDEGEKIVLFIQENNSFTLNQETIIHIKARIRQHASPHHVPDYILSAPDLPRTLNGKLAENAVQKTLAGKTINNLSALLNPECLHYFKTLNL